MPNFIVIASLNLMLAVALGAFGAHGLKARVSPEQLAWWQTAVDYHFWHGLGLLAIGLLLLNNPALTTARYAGLLLQIGILIFCGSLYAMTLGAPRWFGAITPIGGLAFMAGWMFLATASWKLGG
jgi:uncharacterized membrane protein YgdD (TMEM256/DUF423 family)